MLFQLPKTFAVLAVVLLEIGPSSPARADDPPPAPAVEAPSFESLTDAAGLIVPCTGPEDWIRLTSSEWLHGRIREFKVKSLDFKSIRLKELKIKWKHVAELCTAYPMRFVTNEMVVHTGPGRLTGDNLYVWTHDGVVRIERGRLFGILRGEPTELNRWNFKGSLGLDANRGNTDQVSFNAGIEIARRSVTTLFAGRYDVSLGSANNVENVNRQEGRLRGQRDITRALYVSLFDVTVLTDKFQNIDLRATPGAGFGYRLFDTPSFEVELVGEVIYQFTRFDSVTVGGSTTTDDAGTRFSIRGRWDITGDLEFVADHATSLVITDFGQSSYKTRVGLIYDLTDVLKLEFRLNHNRIREPRRNADGVLPDQDDLQTILAFSLDLRP